MTPDPPAPPSSSSAPPPAIWAGLMAGFAPAPTDRSSTGTFDQGGPTGVEADG